ncbi:MAG TPA: HNH endonuclease signature motif containing protein [Candidatus Eisenbacteria bacterium]|nr:HNH endonuclease signature motif containing protein [Candidatus Eisenbacteria bacterium]
MVEEKPRKGPEFTKDKRVRLAQEVGYKCQGCGEELPLRGPTNQKQPALEIHHVVPRSHGGTNDVGNAAVLCNPRSCHQIADELAARYNITFPEVRARFGDEPFKHYKRRKAQRPEKRSPTRQVVRRLLAS